MSMPEYTCHFYDAIQDPRARMVRHLFNISDMSDFRLTPASQM